MTSNGMRRDNGFEFSIRV